MKYLFELNSKAELNESVEKKHESLVSFLKLIGPPFGIDNKTDIQFPGFGKEFTAIQSISKFLGKGINATLFFRYRNMLRDDHSSDDRIYYEINIKKFDYSHLINELLPNFICAFNAYKAELFPEELIYLDFEKSRNLNAREKIYRFYPNMFISSKLCESALAKPLSKAIEIITPIVENVKLINNGIYFQASSTPLTVHECNEFDRKMHLLLL